MLNQKSFLLFIVFYLIGIFSCKAQFKTELEKAQDSIIMLLNEKNNTELAGLQNQEKIIAYQKEKIQLQQLQLDYSNKIIDLNNTDLNLYLEQLKGDKDTLKKYQEFVNEYYVDLKELKKIEIEKGNETIKKLEEAVKRSKAEQLISREDEFKVFISRFNTDPLFQLESFNFPLEILTLKDPTVDNDHDTIQMTIKEYYRISFTPLNSNIVDGEIKLSYQYPSSNLAIILVQQEETGVHIEYYFSRQKGLWKLMKVLDMST